MFRLIGLPLLTKDLRINEEYMDRFDYLVKCLKERGIYLYWALSWGGRGDLYVSPASREAWEKGLSTVLKHLNPYTKTRLLDDPMLAVLLFVNEQEIRPRNVTKGQVQAWQKFLQRKYRSMDGLRTAWKGLPNLPQEGSFDQLEFFGQSEIWKGDAQRTGYCSILQGSGRGDACVVHEGHAHTWLSGAAFPLRLLENPLSGGGEEPAPSDHDAQLP